MCFSRLVFIFAVMSQIVSCSSDGEERHEYMDSYSVAMLEIPPELTRPSSNEELRIPEPSARALALLKSRDEVEGSVAPKFKGISLQSNGDMYWLLLDKDADDVWPVLRDFLANEGIKIYRDEALLGFIETEWIKEYESNRDAGFLKKMFNVLSADTLDKFRLRLERIEAKQQTRLFISHRSLEIEMLDETSRWSQAAPNQMLEREFLYRMALFAGLLQQKADDVFAEYKPYQSRIRPIGEEDASKYEITGNKDFVWKRVIQAVDRLGADIIRKNPSSGSLEIMVGEMVNELVKEKDELSESSWLMNLMADDDDALQDEQGRVSVLINLKESGESTHMQLSLADNHPIVGGMGNKFKQGLIGLLK